MKTKQEILRTYFGHDRFRAGQEQIVDSLLAGRDVLCVMPTGAGKSVCYQVPAMLLPGVTVVVSPLISLMKDQVGTLNSIGIPAAYLNRSLSAAQYAKALQRAAAGAYRILYVAPERLETPGFLQLCGQLDIALVAVDEAHCVSQWGQDFRPSYRRIADWLATLPHRPPVGAFTATATDLVRTDIVALLRLRDPCVMTTGFDRPNLWFEVQRPTDKAAALLSLLRDRAGKSGIVYCATRKEVESVCALLCKRSFSATRYHAGLTERERMENQEDFVYDRSLIMVATNAFGMGIDKPDVAFVIHYNMPKDMESYYQEAGRAGRDGSAADCILLYSPRDVHTNTFLITHGEPNPDLTDQEQAAIRANDLQRLKKMTFYATTNDCLRGYFLRYFGERAPAYCGKCANCQSQFTSTDITREAQMLLSCVSRTEQRYGRKMICDILRGSENERLLRLRLDRQTTYGLLRDTPEYVLQQIMDHLLETEYLAVAGEDYPVLQLTQQSRAVLTGAVTLTMQLARRREPVPRKKPATEVDADPALYAALRALCKQYADRAGIPVYTVFTNATLLDMCRKMPRTDEEFLAVSGVGQRKLEKYGKAFLAAIAAADKR